MHSLLSRANSLATFFGTVAAVVCILTAMTDLIHKSNPTAQVGLAEVKKLAFSHHLNHDQAVITFNLTADLRSVFSWNTKQLFVWVQAEYVTPDNKLNHVVLWDAIIQKKEQALLKLKKHKTKYAFVDHFKGLRQAKLNLSLHWDVMPYVGYFQIHSLSFPAGRLPSSYT